MLKTGDELFLSSELSFYIISLGCSKNLVDSERINGEMISAGFTPAMSSEDADIIIINTCGFIKEAKEEAIEVIFEAVDLKESSDHERNPLEFPGKKVAALGCLTKRYFDEIKNDIPEIDFLYPIPDSSFVPEMASAFNIKINQVKSERRKLYSNFSYSYIKISDGCSNNCSYCAIPLIRGGNKPFDPDFIYSEALNAVKNGALELVIIAQDIAAYKWGDVSLPQIADRISGIPGLRWIRLLYCHPDNMTDDIIELIARNEKVVPYIDIPFQHINGRILSSMGRKGNYSIYMELVEKLRSKVENIVIRSTFMVGYPGETEAEFNDIIRFLKEARLDKVGCFIFSPEDDTRAFLLNDDVPDEVKQARYDAVMSLQRDISAEKMESLIGAELDVIVEDSIDKETCIGRSIYDAPEVDGVFYLTSGPERVNSIVRARVTDAYEYDLTGEIL
jgi:ribosomal protein S12 methylthiotransferase